MPSFRASVAVQGARRGVAPQSVLDAARAGVARSCHVEDAFVDVGELTRGAGPPRVTIRFVVPASRDEEEDARAWQAGRDLAAAVGRIADWSGLRVLRRNRGNWLPLDGPTSHP